MIEITRRGFVAFAAGAGFAAAAVRPLAAVAAGSDAKAFVTSIYAHYVGPDAMGLVWNENLKSARRWFSEPFAKLIVAESDSHPGELGEVIDVDLFVGGQDYQIDKVDVAITPVDATHAEAVVAFVSFGHPIEMRLKLVEEKAGWRIDDIVHPGPDRGSVRARYEAWAAAQKKPAAKKK